jgi:hypothetical protein
MRKHRIAAIPVTGSARKSCPRAGVSSEHGHVGAAANWTAASRSCSIARRARLVRSHGCQRRASVSFTSSSARATAPR